MVIMMSGEEGDGDDDDDYGGTNGLGDTMAWVCTYVCNSTLLCILCGKGIEEKGQWGKHA